MSQRGYRSGDFWRCCDVCGFDYRASQTLKRWDGLYVCINDWEARHPQDHVRAHMDRQRVPDARPEPTDTFLTDPGGGLPIGLLLTLTYPKRNLG